MVGEEHWLWLLATRHSTLSYLRCLIRYNLIPQASIIKERILNEERVKQMNEIQLGVRRTGL